MPHSSQHIPDDLVGDVVINVLDCDIVVSEFELHSCYFLHFHIDTLLKGMNVSILQLVFFYKDSFDI